MRALTPPPGLLLAVAVGLVLTACSAGTGGAAPAASPATASPTSPPTAPATGSPASTASPAPAGVRLEPQVLATGLEVPWGLAFLPSGDALVSERDSARVLRVPAGGGEPVQVRRLDGLAAPRGEGGLLGLALSPGFAEDDLVYAYVTTRTDNRVVRFPLSGGPVQDVLTGIPRDRVHNGGRIAFGPDGALYVGTGDAGRPELAQDPGSLAGKVLRVTPEGGPVDGTRVLSDGHRNVQGLAFDAEGRLWATEFGQNAFDEVNQVQPGDDGGWPEVEGPGDGGGRFAAPQVVWEPAEASPSGAAVLGDDLWVAALRGQRLWRVPIGGGTAGEPEAVLQGELGRLRHVAAAPDGSLWLLTSNRDGRGEPVPADDRVVRLPPA